MTELNVGHFRIGQAIVDGLPGIVARLRAMMLAARP